MHKNQQGFGILLVLAVAAAVAVTGLVGLKTYNNHRGTADKDPTNQSTATDQKPSNTVTGDDKPYVDPNQDNTSKDYPKKPTAPSDLKVIPAGSGYTLTWGGSVATGYITKYQVFYQGNMVAEPTDTSYLHQLPSPPPGCNPIPLTYFVRAVDNEGSASVPSNSVTVQFGGC